MIIFILMVIISVSTIILLKKWKNRCGRNKEGRLGECEIHDILRAIKPRKSVVLKNVYLPYRGRTTEIDLLYITTKGVFVIESKNYAGVVYGDEKQKNWLKISNVKKSYFYNPIWQNNTHLSALKEQFSELDERRFFSYIVFGNKTNLGRIKIRSKGVCVLKSDRMQKQLRRDLWWRRPFLTKTEVRKMKCDLVRYTDPELKKEHLRDVKKIIKEYKKI